MKMRLVVATAIFCILLMPSIVSAHDQKEYNILITEDGLTPSSINPGILVETDTLFFRNIDDRQAVEVFAIKKYSNEPRILFKMMEMNNDKRGDV